MIKDTFQIKDLENLTGIKIPTLRIWEKRYGIIKPTRTNTGIRYYNVQEVSKLLNIVYLNRNGWKISKIAVLTDDQINLTIKELDQHKNDYSIEVEEFLIAMLSFNQIKFNQIYKKLRDDKSFETIFEKYFYPLLLRVGILWQTNTIEIIHEHFITSLIIQKIIFEIENLNDKPLSESKTYILFLPVNEMHEIGLRYLQYQLLLHKKETIYLGNHIDLPNLKRFRNRKDVVLIVNLTINPDEKSLIHYLTSLNEFVLETKLPVYLYGLQFDIHAVISEKFKNIHLHKTAKELLNSINS
tara:strand:+ start:416 stop:1309 length:894 start_codon:yes stop_codon:yes gene_type:complete